MTLALLCGASGWTTASAQDGDAQKNNKLVFAVVVRQIFNQGDLALVDDFVAKDVTNNGAPLAFPRYRAWLIESSDRSEFVTGKELVIGQAIRIRPVLPVKSQLPLHEGPTRSQFDDVLVMGTPGKHQHRRSRAS